MVSVEPLVEPSAEAMVEPEGRRQVQYRKEVKATVLDATELQCWTPEVNFMATMLVEV